MIIIFLTLDALALSPSSAKTPAEGEAAVELVGPESRDRKHWRISSRIKLLTDLLFAGTTPPGFGLRQYGFPSP
ncbi:hypothetical protein ACFX2B_003858 [Malus domestica]